jgi:hypothetical protein
MRPILTALLFGFLLLAAGCHAGQMKDNAPDRSPEQAGRYPVIYPTGGAIKFPEDQVIKKEVRVTTRWQTITFEKPLQINRQGLMGLHLAVDQEPYISTTDNDPRNLDCSDAEYQKNAFSLRRRSDWVLVRPEAVLVGDNGVEVKVRPTGHLYPYFDKHVMTIALRTFKDMDSPPPDFPESIQTFTVLRIRSTAPFVIRYLWWKVDQHPEIYSK